VPYVGNGKVRAYVYSNRGFAFPGESFKTPAVLSVDFFEKRALVFLLKDGKVYKVWYGVVYVSYKGKRQRVIE